MKTCTICGVKSERITWMGRGEYLCDDCKEKHNHPPAFVERLFRNKHGMWMTRAMLKHYQDNGRWGERFTDSKGNVTTRTMSASEASRKVVHMGQRSA